MPLIDPKDRISQSDDELHVGLDIPNHVRREIHTWARQQPWPEGTELEHPHDYHITMLYTPDGHEQHKDGWWINHLDQARAKVQGLHTFPAGEKGHPYVLKIDSPEIVERATELQNRALQHGLSVTQFPGGYKPHLTLGYGPSEPTGIKPPNWEFDVGPSSVSPIRPPKTAAINDPLLDHLNQQTGWQWSTDPEGTYSAQPQPGDQVQFGYWPPEADETHGYMHSLQTRPFNRDAAPGQIWGQPQRKGYGTQIMNAMQQYGQPFTLQTQETGFFDRFPWLTKGNQLKNIGEGSQNAPAAYNYSFDPSLQKTAAPKQAMPADPDWWSTQNDLWHGTQLVNMPSIMQHGILPWDDPQHPHGSMWGAGMQATNDYEPRPGHVYLSTDPNAAYEALRNYDMYDPEVLFKVDPSKLDPQNINPDEDYLEKDWGWGDTRVKDKYPEYAEWKNQGPPQGGRPRSLGEVSEEIGLGNDTHETQRGIETMGTLAHRGRIPPEALTPYVKGRDNRWMALPRADWGATSLEDLEHHYATKAPTPPEYGDDKGTVKEHCGNCKMFYQGHCWGFGNYEVKKTGWCKDWYPPQGKKSAYNPDKTQVLDHLSLTNVAANLHYKFEEGGMDSLVATEYAKKMLKLIGYPQDDITVQAALQAWQTIYPNDKIETEAQPSAPATVPTESWGYGTTSYNRRHEAFGPTKETTQDLPFGPYRQALAQGPESHEDSEIEPFFPSIEDAIEANQASLGGWGQTNHSLLRPDVLEGALARPQQYWHYTGSLPQAAAALVHGVGQSQAFEDGNKRTAYWLTHHFLHENGLGHIAPSDDVELANHLVGYGEGTHQMEDTAQMFENRLGQHTAGLNKTADKLHDFLMNPKSRPDLQSAEGQAFLNHLERFYHNEKTDPLMPWLTREWKKGRIRYENPADIRGEEESVPHLRTDNPIIQQGEWNTRLLPQQLNHWADFLRSNHPVRRELGDIMKHTMPSFWEKVHQWDNAMEQEAQQQQLQGGQVVHTTPDNWTVRKLTTPEELEAEGDSMGHCVGNYDQDVADGKSLIYSLRDPGGTPHITMEIEPTQLTPESGEDDPEWLDKWIAGKPNHPERENNESAQAARQDPNVIAGLQRYQKAKAERAMGLRQTYDPEELEYQGLYNQLDNLHGDHPMVGLPHNGHVIQIQGQANKEPKPEYKARLADWFHTFKPEELPQWDDEWAETIDHPHKIKRSDLHPNEPDEYGLKPQQHDVYWDDLVKNSIQDNTPWRRGYTEYTPQHVEDIYRLALARGEIPALAHHITRFGEEQQADFDYWIMQNEPHAPWPDVRTDEWNQMPQEQQEEAWQQAEQEWRDEMAQEHPGMQTVNHFYSLLNPHWWENYPNSPGGYGEYRNEVFK